MLYFKSILRKIFSDDLHDMMYSKYSTYQVISYTAKIVNKIHRLC